MSKGPVIADPPSKNGFKVATASSKGVSAGPGCQFQMSKPPNASSK